MELTFSSRHDINGVKDNANIWMPMPRCRRDKYRQQICSNYVIFNKTGLQPINGGLQLY